MKPMTSVIADDILSEFQRRLELLERALAGLDASREEERRWIARELHDRAAHGLAVTLQRLDQHKRLISVDADHSQRVFDAAIESLHESLRAVQEVSTGLRHVSFRHVSVRHVKGENLGLKMAIEAYLRDNVPCGVRADLVVSGALEALPRRVCEELYLIIREACRNALRHAGPAKLSLSIAITGPVLTAIISDDGCGFDVAATMNGTGGGLPSMAERAGLLDGSVTVESLIGRGTAVTIRIPLPDDGAA